MFDIQTLSDYIATPLGDLIIHTTSTSKVTRKLWMYLHYFQDILLRFINEFTRISRIELICVLWK